MIHTIFESTPDQIKYALEWAESRKRYDAKTYFLFMYIMITIVPDFYQYVKFGKGHCKLVTLTENQIAFVTDLLAQFEDSVKRAGYFIMTDGYHSYTQLITTSINCLKCWIQRDFIEANNLLQQVFIEVSLLRSLKIPALYFLSYGSFVAYQLSYYDPKKLNLCEALILKINKIKGCAFKILLDYLLGTVSINTDVPNDSNCVSNIFTEGSTLMELLSANEY
jgi:hypothetical protein